MSATIKNMNHAQTGKAQIYKTPPRLIKQVYFLANTGAGRQTAELSELCDLLDDTGINYDLHKVTSWKELSRHSANLKPHMYDAILVYGGDGSVLTIAHKLSNGKVPLCILPGGTNNALASSLGQNLSATQALKALIDGRYDKILLDIARCNDKPIIFDLHYGLLAAAIADTPRHLKRTWGSLAYAMTAIRQLKQLEFQEFTLKLDSKIVNAKAIICYITNSGLPEFLGIPLFKRKRANDGFLDIAFIKTVAFWPLLLWFMGHAWLGRGSKRSVELHRAKKITIIKAPNQVFYDDINTTMKPPATISVQPNSLPVIVPHPTLIRQRLKAWVIWLNIQLHRGLDHLRRILTGVSALGFSQLNDSFFIGGQPGRGGLKKLQMWGVTAIVSMRTSTPASIPKGIKVLHLPTTDNAPISLRYLQKGVDFITKQIEAGGKVYVHCRMGEGRAASMAIAYLVSQGMFLNDALSFIKQRRVFIHPNKKQLARLREYARLQGKSK